MCKTTLFIAIKSCIIIQNVLEMRIIDIAEQLGLSITTVSRALDGYPDVAEKTRERVAKAAFEAGYVPNQAARQLRRKKTDTIGFVLSSNGSRFSDPFCTELITNLSDACMLHRQSMIVSAAAMESAQEKNVYAQFVKGGKVDGIILNRLRVSDWRVEYLRANAIPFVALDTLDGLDDISCVRIDHQAAMSQLVEHFLSKGFDRFGYLGGPEGLHIERRRFMDYERVVSLSGHSLPAINIRRCDLTSQNAYECCRELFTQPEPPSALFCVTDKSAFGALKAAREVGLRVNQDIAIAGYDGLQESQYVEPALTTIDQPIAAIALSLVDLLIKRISAPHDPPTCTSIQCRLIIRESTQTRSE